MGPYSKKDVEFKSELSQNGSDGENAEMAILFFLRDLDWPPF